VSKHRKRPAARDPNRKSLAAILLLTLAMAWFAYQKWFPPSPALPKIPSHSDPIVAAQINEAAEAVQKSPRSGMAWGHLGMVLHAYLFEDEARACFANAQRFDRDEPRWPYFEGVILLASDPEGGLRKLGHSVELCPSTPDTPRLQYARTLFEHGRMAEAEAQFQDLLARNPGHTPALLGLARIAHSRGQSQKATEYLRRCLESPFTARSAYLLLAAVQSKASNAPAALAASQTAPVMPPDQSWPEPYTDEILRLQSGSQKLLSEAERALRENRYDDAKPLVAQLLKDYSGSAEAWLLAGRLRLDQKDCKGAEEALRRYLQFQPDSVNGNARLGAALLCQERYTEAISSFERAVQLKPDFAEGHFNLGFARARAGDGGGAIAAFRDAIRCSPNFIEPHITLADLLSQQGQVEEAVALLQRAREINPNDTRLAAVLERVKTRR
jgi:tetratricopeptide (TPR) repeat protein